ncbi:MAG: magnesium chelatase ATPase subunit D, partial [Pseudomonadota bacterium]
MSPRDELALPGPAAPEPPQGPDPEAVWSDAALAAALLAIDPGLGGALVRARPGPARDAWTTLHAGLQPEGAPLRRMPAAISEDRLLGGLDLAATLSARRPVWSPGVLAEADGGTVVLPMAERAAPGLIAHLSAALDRGEIRAERDGRTAVSPARIAVIALDEGAEPDERAPQALADRLAFRLELDGLPRAALPQDPLADAPASPDDIAEARARLAEMPAPPELSEALVRAAESLGVDGLRAPLLALRAARAAAALLGAETPGEIEAALAARLVLAPRATRLPAPPPEETAEDDDQTPPPEPPPETDEAPEAETPPAETRDAALEDKVLEAAAAALPPDLLARMAAEATRRPAAPGGAGARASCARRRRRPGRRGGGWPRPPCAP